MKQATIQHVKSLVTEPSHAAYFAGERSLVVGEFVVLGKSTVRNTTLLVTVQADPKQAERALANWKNDASVRDLELYELVPALDPEADAERVRRILADRHWIDNCLLVDQAVKLSKKEGEGRYATTIKHTTWYWSIGRSEQGYLFVSAGPRTTSMDHLE